MMLDPDAAARVASFGEMQPMRVRGLAAVREAIESAPHPDTMPSMAHIEDCAIPGAAGQIPIRIYRPSSDSGGPVLVYFHGGGMVMGSNHSFEPLARTLAAESNATVVSVDYRLAPEYPPPAQFDDAYTATTWVADHADRLRRRSDRGWRSSATAPEARWPPRSRWRLATTTALPSVARCCSTPVSIATWRARRSRHWPTHRCSPSTTSTTCTTSPTAVQARHTTPTASPPMQPTFPGCRQAIVVTGECDPIRDWGERYAARLRDARVQMTVTRYPGMYHGFLMRSDATARGRLAIAEIGGLLRAKFASSPAALTSRSPDTCALHRPFRPQNRLS